MITRGSEWRRWEPHIHGPGTILNSQFGRGDPWHTYLSSLEAASPKIEVIGITDYYVTDTYEEVLRYKAAGRLAGTQLIFPNIEVRLDVAAKSGFVNIHLLISPETADHLMEIQRVMSRLHFNAFDDRFDCTRDDLIRLGRRADDLIIDDRAALAYGATQFKVHFAQLKEVLKQSKWAKDNILIAVAGSEGDGTSGVRQAADTTVRQEIEKFSHIIFSSNKQQREFWLGQRGVSIEQLRDRYDGCKPCLHGSDAHDQASVGKPQNDRFSWLKGAPHFDALRQACIDPGGRAFVGVKPPQTSGPSQVISQIDVEDAPWAATTALPLNPGLIAIIGARGSGKTALADMIAAGCDAIPESVWYSDGDASPSFLVRARPLVGNAKVKLTWGGGFESSRHLDGRDAHEVFAYPKARYLSQQFVEELCSSRGASEGLIREIERVVFEAHSHEERHGATNFGELYDQHTSRFKRAHEREVDNIADTSDRIAAELEKEALTPGLTVHVSQKEGLLKGYNSDLANFVIKGSEAHALRHTALNEAAQRLVMRVQDLGSQRRIFVAMQDEVANTRAAKAPEMLRQTQSRFPGSGLSAEQWDAFLLVYKGNVSEALVGYMTWANNELAKLNGLEPLQGDPGAPLISLDTDLSTVPLAVLRAEMARLASHISADNDVRSRYAALAKRIAAENGALQGLKARLDDAQGAAARRKVLQKERECAYRRLFDVILNEQQALIDLYAPLMKRLNASSGTLRKLSFTVTRSVDATSWANVAEDRLIDCRKSGPFYGRGSLARLANSELKPVWENGSALEIQSSMTNFISAYSQSLLGHAPVAPSQQADFREWLKQFAHWLFSVDHIKVRYEIAYDGVDIRKLSPGTRGIVLLLLYLALDDADDRPLIIDQPEENLDPKSVFEELVALFIAAKVQRQVIIVTHNSNLVINTDADQIIVANAGSHANGGLPSITYTAGGLEDAAIRETVCGILEGGADAFRERARRLRVRLER